MLRLRYRLSTFLVFVTLVAVGCWWYTYIRPKWLADSSLKELKLLQSNQKTGQVAWGAEMRSLVEIGPKSLPVLIQSLDTTPFDDRLNLRTIPFAMRCLDDPRAVPSLIRAIPRCFGSDGSDMGYNIGDPELAKFLAEKHGDSIRTGYVYGRPVNEVFRALKHLTGQSFDHMELAFVTENEYDTEQQTYLKRKLYEESAHRWAEWWEANWSDFTSDHRFAKVDLPARTALRDAEMDEIDETVERVFKNRFHNIIVQPVCAASDHLCFLDLDTNRWAILPSWFRHIVTPVDVLPADVLQWAREEGFDLYGAVVQSSEKECFVVRTIDTQVFEVDLEAGRGSITLALAMREGTLVGNVIAHWDKDTQEPQLESTGEFVFITKENTVGRIALGVAVNSVVQPIGRVQGDPNLQSSGRYLGRRIGLSYLVPKR